MNRSFLTGHLPLDNKMKENIHTAATPLSRITLRKSVFSGAGCLQQSLSECGNSYSEPVPLDLPDVVSKTYLQSTPVQRANKVFSYVDTPRYEDNADKISPGLTKLRMTPGVLKEKQKRLISQHEEIRQKSDQLKTGGGVSLWPQMPLMRLTSSEITFLVFQATFLSVVTAYLLQIIHGNTFTKLSMLGTKVELFCDNHPITEQLNQSVFQAQVTGWHSGLLHLKLFVSEELAVKAMSTSCQLYSLTYIFGLATLLYYLLDNMLACNKLTPTRIKKWTCLLVVIGSWTAVMSHGLLLAHQLEDKLLDCVQQYSSSLADLVITQLDLDTYQAVLLYWRSQLLDDASPGVVKVMGVVSVKHIIHYLQFYSVPIVTVILSPILKLCCACFAVYRNGEYVRMATIS